jgi:hypothetical protein
MRLPLIVLALLSMVAIAGCSGQANVDITSGTATPSVVALAATPLSAPTVVDASVIPEATITSAATRTPRVAVATKSPSATPTPLDIDGQLLPVPADAKETRNIPAVARNFAQNQLKGQSRIGQPHAYVVSQARDQLLATYRQQLTSSGWEAIPISGLQDPIDVLFAQKSNVRATIVFASEDNGSTLMYIVATRP